LERHFERSELRELNGDEALGSYGFSITFFRKCCEVLREDIMKVFKEFQGQGKFDKSFNVTFCPLSPRKPMQWTLRIFVLLV
jgi:hypothetical protein